MRDAALRSVAQGALQDCIDRVAVASGGAGVCSQ